MCCHFLSRGREEGRGGGAERQQVVSRQTVTFFIYLFPCGFCSVPSGSRVCVTQHLVYCYTFKPLEYTAELQPPVIEMQEVNNTLIHLFVWGFFGEGGWEGWPGGGESEVLLPERCAHFNIYCCQRLASYLF